MKNATTGAEDNKTERKNKRKIKETKSWLFKKINNVDKPLAKQIKKRERSDKLPTQERSKGRRRPCRQRKAGRGTRTACAPQPRGAVARFLEIHAPPRRPWRSRNMRPDADTARGPTRGPGPDGFPGEVPPRSEKDRRLLFSNPASTPKGRQPFPAPQSQNHARGWTYTESSAGQRRAGKTRTLQARCPWEHGGESPQENTGSLSSAACAKDTTSQPRSGRVVLGAGGPRHPSPVVTQRGPRGWRPPTG